MKSKTFLASLVVLSMGIGSLALAQDRDRRDDHDRDRGGPPHRDMRDDRSGAGPNHDWRKGGRLPSEYRGRQYVVDDWRGHHLRQPPRGYHWVQSGPDYVLAAIATGVIADILLNH